LGPQEARGRNLATEALGIPLRGTRNFGGEGFGAVTSVQLLFDKNFQYFSKNFLHLWKFAVISHMRTNFAEMPGNRSAPGSRESQSLIR